MRFSEGQVRKVLEAIDIEVLDERGDELVALCPGHEQVTGHKDHKPSWSINTETGVHFDFSCGYKGTLYSLVHDLRGPEVARALVPQWEGGPILSRPPSALFGGWRVNRGASTRPGEQVEVEDPSVSEMALERYPDVPPRWALKERRITVGTAEKYGLRWDSRREAWVLPIRLPDGRLIGWQVKSQRGRSYVRNLPVKMNKASTLFGANVLDVWQTVVVVESPLDAVMLSVLGYNAAALCGSKVSDEQLAILQRHPRVLFALDNDRAGHQEMHRLRRLPRLGVPATFAKYQGGDPKDVGEMSHDRISALLHRV